VDEVRTLSGSPFISGRIPVCIKSASVHMVGESEVRGSGVMGCGGPENGER